MMKSTMTTLFLLLGINFFVMGTHNRGGYITYKHLGSNEYEIKVVTFTEYGSVNADRPVLGVYINGFLDSIPRSFRQYLSANLQENVYVTTYTFPGPGRYWVIMEDPSRGPLINIPNAINVPFFIESELIISSFSGHTDGVVMAAPFMGYATLGQTFRWCLDAFGDDSHTGFELRVPRGAGGKEVATYSFPDDVSINPVNGELTWNPTMVGEYAFAVRIFQCENDIEVGSSFVEFNVSVGPADPYAYHISGHENWSKDARGNYAYTVSPGSSLDLDLVVRDSNQWKAGLEIVGEPLMNHGASATTIYSDQDSVHKAFSWAPNASHVRCAPYLVNFSVKRDGISTYDLPVLIYVRDATTTQCDQECLLIYTHVEESEEIENLPHWYPNPFREEVWLDMQDWSGDSYNVKIFDVNGRTIYQATDHESRLRIANQNWPKGIYFYHLNTDSGRQSSGRLVVE